MGPVFKQFVVCREVLQDPLTRQIHIQGVFDSVRPVGSPHKIESLCVYTVCSDADAAVNLRFRVVDTDDMLVFESAAYLVAFESRLRPRHVCIRVQGAPFPGPGVFFVELYCNDEIVADWVLTLTK